MYACIECLAKVVSFVLSPSQAKTKTNKQTDKQEKKTTKCQVQNRRKIERNASLYVDKLTVIFARIRKPLI